MVACSRIEWKVSNTCSVVGWSPRLPNSKTRGQSYVYDCGCDDVSWPTSGLQNGVSNRMWSLLNQLMMSIQSVVLWVDRWTEENFQIFLHRNLSTVINFWVVTPNRRRQVCLRWLLSIQSKRVGRDSERGVGVFGKMWLQVEAKMISKIEIVQKVRKKMFID
jgi:hypothetical protein